jgi:hypothetical protein
MQWAEGPIRETPTLPLLRRAHGSMRVESSGRDKDRFAWKGNRRGAARAVSFCGLLDPEARATGRTPLLVVHLRYRTRR